MEGQPATIKTAIAALMIPEISMTAATGIAEAIYDIIADLAPWIQAGRLRALAFPDPAYQTGNVICFLQEPGCCIGVGDREFPPNSFRQSRMGLL
jgi:hypothetical protein